MERRLNWCLTPHATSPPQTMVTLNNTGRDLELTFPGFAHRSSFIVHRSSFIVHRSSFIVHHSSLTIHHSFFIIHHSPFVNQRSCMFRRVPWLTSTSSLLPPFISAFSTPQAPSIKSMDCPCLERWVVVW